MTGLSSMESRNEILKAKWLIRYEYLLTLDIIFICKIEKLAEDYDLIPRMIQMKSETSLNLTNLTAEEIKKVIVAFNDHKFEESKNSIKLFNETSLKDVPSKEIYKLICGFIGEREHLHMLSLYIEQIAW